MKTICLLGFGLLVIVLVALAFLLQPTYSADKVTLSLIQDAVTQQQKIEEDLQAYYKVGNYTFTQPLVIQDPYKNAPLTALLIFDTPEKSQISIHVPGKTSTSDVNFTFDGYKKHHELPIYGLYADTLNHVTLSLTTQNGESAQTGVDLQTEPLPVTMQEFQIDRADPVKYSPGFNFAFMDSKPVFDIDGNVRWYSTRPSWWVFARLQNGHFLFTYSVIGQDNNYMMEQDLLGKIYTVYTIPDGIHHDIFELPSGNLLFASADLKLGTLMDHITEIDRETGHIVRSFDLRKILDASRPAVIGLGGTDWLHLNSIIYDDTDNTIIISGKAQSAVVKLTYPGMEIKWILGPHDNWSEKYQPYLLTPVGENLEWPWSQHHATLYEPNVADDNIIDILLFDNGMYRSFDRDNAFSPPEWYSRVVHYHIDEGAMTIEQEWDYSSGAGIFALNQSGAYLLPNGNILGTWSAIAKDPQGNPVAKISDYDTYTSKIIEIDPLNNEVVFEASAPDTAIYRTLRAGLYEGYLDDNAYLSTHLKDNSGNDLVDRSIIAWRDIKSWMNTVSWLLALKRFARRVLTILH
jgi:arylsulfate sulfotransferase